ncbi:hypothetical protein G7Z17_g8848 [Cylindrodendrum hubeiense]|uniref:Uncharacterized protein n=1 Tax=Cylindrodendrum hubeiense TaxID=595255 RepID=A0A9P5LDX4_9HYPO|nr:hypothetical protein G7Z17_g8848 [Cylindrodendrum hubeiense]
MADSMNYLYTIGGYAALFGVGYVVYHVSTQKNQKRAGVPLTKAPKVVPAEPRKEEKKKKKQRMESFTSEAQGSSKKAANPSASTEKAEPSAWLSNVQDNTPDDVDNVKFAKQLAKAQSGAKFASKSEGGKQREKSVKQSRANKINVAAEQKESAPSSTTGADADDDQSPITSPITSPEVGPAVAGDVSDMLEATPARPAVLRLTDTAPKQQKQKVAKAPEPVESKKQRQNRKKAEAAKAPVKSPRRSARPSRRSNDELLGAPSGTKATPAAQTNGFHQPLDTFEQPAPSTTGTTKPAAAAKSTQGNWVSSLPSEEEQIELLKTDEDEWSTVKTKSSKKASKNESSVDSGDEPSQPRVAVQPKQTVVATKSAPSFGAFSALSTKDEPADEDEVEEEWDV